VCYVLVTPCMFHEYSVVREITQVPSDWLMALPLRLARREQSLYLKHCSARRHAPYKCTSRACALLFPVTSVTRNSTPYIYIYIYIYSYSVIVIINVL